MTDIPFDFPELTAQAIEAAKKAAPLAPWPVSNAWRLFLAEPAQFFRSVNAEAEPLSLYLYYYLHFTRFVHETYRERKIPEEVFYNTFSDIGRWEKVCFEHTGIHGLEEYEWLALHLRLELFGLGRLQFQPIPCPWNVPGPHSLKKGESVLNVHIPAGEKLSPALCESSYRQAERFFTPLPAIFICRSWLLCPALKKLLPPDSNILHFQEEYIILGVEEDSRQAEERIFGCLKSNPAEYPETNSLQKAAKAWLISGNTLPEGYGVKISVSADGT